MDKIIYMFEATGPPEPKLEAASVAEVNPDTSMLFDPSLHLDNIAARVNAAIAEMGQVYRLIGYLGQQIVEKQAEIFKAIDTTISQFSSNLQREKSSIGNECEWLRQQICVILAMLNDCSGTRHLSPQNRQIVFDEQSLQPQYADPFSEVALVQTKLSLLQIKAALNGVFLDVLTSFVRVFVKFTEQVLMYWDNVEIIGEPSAFPKNLPAKEEAEEHFALANDFESCLRLRRVATRASEQEVVISSPRKNSGGALASGCELLDALRETNYKIVRVIRGLKVTKITLEVIAALKAEVERTETEIASRKEKLCVLVRECLDLIALLDMSEQDVLAVQKLQGHDGVFFDTETLAFIEKNPREFGLMERHIGFVSQMAAALRQIRETRQKQWDYLVQRCTELWAKLGEDEAYRLRVLAENGKLSESSIASLKAELNRLFLKRLECIESFIAGAQREIAELQALLFYADSERAFACSSEDKEQVLNEHEAEVRRLQGEYAAKQPVLELYAQLRELLDDQRFLAESLKDLSRLMSKNSCRILLNEERLRKKIHKNMPRVIAALLEAVGAYNAGGTPFKVNGEDFYERLLAIETEQLNPGRRPRPSASPKRTSGRTSPLKLETRSPLRVNMRSPPRVNTRSPQRFQRSPNAPSRSPQRSPHKVTKPGRLQPLNQPLYPETRHIGSGRQEARHSESCRPDTRPPALRKPPLQPANVNVPVSEKRRSSVGMDDYQLWRAERLRQMNHVSSL